MSLPSYFCSSSSAEYKLCVSSRSLTQSAETGLQHPVGDVVTWKGLALSGKYSEKRAEVPLKIVLREGKKTVAAGVLDAKRIFAAAADATATFDEMREEVFLVPKKKNYTSVCVTLG